MSTWTERLQLIQPISEQTQKGTQLFPVNDFLEPGDSYMVKRIECKSPAEEEKAMREGQFAINNPHPRICRCYQVKLEEKPEGGRYVYLLLERMPLSFYQDIETRKSTFSYYAESELWRILREAVSVYTFLQQRVSAIQNIVHRDIKPGNILFDSDRHVKVCDLGFMKVINLKREEVHTMVGTNCYFSPALRFAYLDDNPTPQHNTFKSDVFSLGVTMLHASLLEFPKCVMDLSTFEGVLRQVVQSMGYSQQWGNVLSRMLTLNGDYRPDFLELTEEIRRELNYNEIEPLSNIGFTYIKTPLLLTAKCGLEYVRVDSRWFDEVPCMVSLQAINTSPNARSYAIDFVCVIDESGSMLPPKMKLVQETLNKLMHIMKATDRMCLITFSDSADLRCPLVPCDEHGRARLITVVKQLQARNNTNITAGLQLAADVMDQRQFPNTGAAILLFTDGQHNVGPAPLEVCRERVRREVFQAAKVRIFTFGYGEDSDSSMLSAIAEEGSGVYRFLSAPTDIQDAFALALAELVTIVAKDVEVTLKALPGPVNFQIEKVFSKDGAPFFRLPNIIANQTKDLVFSIKAPYLTLEGPVSVFPAVHVTVAYTNDCNERKTIEGDVVVECRPRKDKEEPLRTTSVFLNLYRMKGADALRKALELAPSQPIEAVATLSRVEQNIASNVGKSHPAIQSLLSDIQSVKSELAETHHIDKNLAAQLEMISYSHSSQVATGPQSYYKSPAQRVALLRMDTIPEMNSDETLPSPSNRTS